MVSASVMSLNFSNLSIKNIGILSKLLRHLVLCKNSNTQSLFPNSLWVMKTEGRDHGIYGQEEALKIIIILHGLITF